MLALSNVLHALLVQQVPAYSTPPRSQVASQGRRSVSPGHFFMMTLPCTTLGGLGRSSLLWPAQTNLAALLFVIVRFSLLKASPRLQEVCRPGHPQCTAVQPEVCDVVVTARLELSGAKIAAEACAVCSEDQPHQARWLNLQRAPQRKRSKVRPDSLLCCWFAAEHVSEGRDG